MTTTTTVTAMARKKVTMMTLLTTPVIVNGQKVAPKMMVRRMLMTRRTVAIVIAKTVTTMMRQIVTMMTVTVTMVVAMGMTDLLRLRLYPHCFGGCNKTNEGKKVRRGESKKKREEPRDGNRGGKYMMKVVESIVNNSSFALVGSMARNEKRTVII